MLIATSRWRDGDVDLAMFLALTSTLRAQFVRRSNLLYDSRVRVGGERRRDVATLYLVLAGSMQLGGERLVASPSAWVLREDEFELAPAKDTPTPWFRSWGQPFIALEICVPRSHVKKEPGLALGARPLGSRTWAAVTALAECEQKSLIGAKFGEAFRALVDEAVLDENALGGLAAEPEHLSRVWSVIADVYERQETGTYVRALGDAMNISVRQAERDLGELAARFGSYGSFRSTLKVMRIRRALLFLSAPTATISGVARLVGYGSAEAMARAFRDANLPAPRVVREILRVH